MLTIDEFHSRPKVVRPDLGASLRAIAQQAARQEAVTGDPDWDYFLAYIENALQTAERERATDEVRLHDPNLVSDDKVRALRMSLIRLDVRIGTLKEVLLLPKYLKKQGDMAKESLANLEPRQK